MAEHPILKTPTDKWQTMGFALIAFAGVRLLSDKSNGINRRTHDRTGVFNHGYALRLQENAFKSLKESRLAQAILKMALKRLRGPGFLF